MSRTAVNTHDNFSEQALGLAKQAGIVIGASAVIAVCARLVLPLPFTPVPLTLANFGVLLVGLALGSKRGFAAAALYLAWGAMGLPVFSPAGVGGIGTTSRSDRRISAGLPGGRLRGRLDLGARQSLRLCRNLVAGMVAEVVLFAFGIAWLAVVTGSWQRALAFGLVPFLFAEVMKVMGAAAVARRIQRAF